MGLNQLDNVVKVRGYKDGLLFVIQPEPTLSEVEEILAQQLSTLGTSLSGIGITLDIGNRHFQEEQLNHFQEWLKKKYGMDIKRIIMDYSQTSEGSRKILAESISKYTIDTIPAEQEQMVAPKEEEVPEPPREKTDVIQDTSRSEQREAEKVSELQYEKARVIRQTLRSGQREEFWGGDLVVLGDVNPGAEVIASKDIIVLGSLRGIAHAGASGDTSAVIIALHLVPTQLRIGNIVSRSPGEERQDGGTTEIARVEGEAVVVEEYKEL